MVDSKMFMAGFLKYLQDYYGMTYGTLHRATGLSNTLKVPLFQESIDVTKEFDAMMALEGEEAPGMGEDEFGMPMGGLAADDLNGMFPGPYDSVGM